MGECFSAASRQRCLVHSMRSMLAHISRRYQPIASALVKTIFTQPIIKEAEEELRRVAQTLRPRLVQVAELVE